MEFKGLQVHKFASSRVIGHPGIQLVNLQTCELANFISLFFQQFLATKFFLQKIIVMISFLKKFAEHFYARFFGHIKIVHDTGEYNVLFYTTKYKAVHFIILFKKELIQRFDPREISW